MPMIDEPLYTIAVLIDELKNDDIQVRLNSIRRLSTFARALGEELTRKGLIPFLSENDEDDDEVLLAMAEELGVFIPYVGGVEYAHVLLPPLEALCAGPETCVSDKAVESLSRIGSQMRESDLVDYFIPMVKRLANDVWFSSRVSACGLFHIAYPSAPEMLKTELRSIYSQLCQDFFPIVRRSAATNLVKFAATVEPAHLKSDLMPLFEELTQDDHNSVRLLAVEGCAALGKLLEPLDCVAHIPPVTVNFSQPTERITEPSDIGSSCPTITIKSENSPGLDPSTSKPASKYRSVSPGFMPAERMSKSNTGSTNVTAKPESSQQATRPLKIDPATLYRSKSPGVKRFLGARV